MGDQDGRESPSDWGASQSEKHNMLPISDFIAALASLLGSSME